MLFNKDYLFIHVPRTAGKCIKSSILNHLEGPRYLCQKHINSNFFNTNNYNHYLKKNTHSSLNQLVKKKFIWPEEIDLNKIKIILCARNPYDRLKSLFKLYALRYYNIKSTKKFEKFEDLTFKKLENKNYKSNGNYRNTYEYCNLNGQIPKNLHFIRYNNLNEDLSNLFGVEIKTEITRHNGIFKLDNTQEKKLYEIKDKDKAVELINQWESWGIENKLFEPVTKDMLL